MPDHARHTLRDIGLASTNAYASQRHWIHRRVETLSFPSAEELIVRRQMSFDFTLPAGLPAARRAGDREVVYVPLSTIRKWPPIIGFDLRTADDTPQSLLTHEENGILDAALLVGLAQEAATPAVLDGDLVKQLEEIARTKPEHAVTAYYEAILSDDELAGNTGVSAARLALAANRQFVALAAALVTQRVLWVPISGQPGDRLIVKLAYDSRREFDLYWFRPAAYGWISFKVEFELPHLGNAGSYHLDIVTPGPLRVIDARMRLYPPRMTQETPDDDHDPFGPIPPDDQALRDTLNIHERANEWRHGTFYAAGPRDHCCGVGQGARRQRRLHPRLVHRLGPGHGAARYGAHVRVQELRHRFGRGHHAALPAGLLG
jgi:hypothetical protein